MFPQIGKPHPDPVVETASMASVEPPEVWYELHLPSSTIDEGKLSALQLEAITYACQQHNHFLPNGDRAGFLIGKTIVVFLLHTDSAKRYMPRYYTARVFY